MSSFWLHQFARDIFKFEIKPSWRLRTSWRKRPGNELGKPLVFRTSFLTSKVRISIQCIACDKKIGEEIPFLFLANLPRHRTMCMNVVSYPVAHLPRSVRFSVLPFPHFALAKRAVRKIRHLGYSRMSAHPNYGVHLNRHYQSDLRHKHAVILLNLGKPDQDLS